jgi:hypothetical protein
MNLSFRPLVAILLALLLFAPFATDGAVHVKGYHRKDGTYVQPHERSAPDGSKANNWSTKGNVNPYTGKPGTKNPDAETGTPSISPASQTNAVQSAPPKTAAENSAQNQRVIEFQTKQAEAGSPQFQYEVGIRYLKGDGVLQNEERGRNWLLKSAKQGNNAAYATMKNTDYLEEKRDEHGRIIRSTTARKEFMKRTGLSLGRPGYVVDHIVPLKKGGCDCPENMQWQTIDEARAKDKWE